MCNVKTCSKNNYPLIVQVNKSIVIDVDFKKEAILKLIPKLDYQSLA